MASGAYFTLKCMTESVNLTVVSSWGSSTVKNSLTKLLKVVGKTKNIHLTFFPKKS